MTAATARIYLEKLSLEDAHLIGDQLRSITARLVAEHDSIALLWDESSSKQAVLEAINYERAKCMDAREALNAALAATFAQLG